ncbi:M15 family metallopeptidase [Streptomyces sp. NPDC006270]|uniref:M15 family metallopeptidase n=1 Tax=Streptomyces sp. NPDC006270 TaxID=3364741 RepID=UPI0036CB929B
MITGLPLDPRKQDRLSAFTRVRAGVLARTEHARSLLPAPPAPTCCSSRATGHWPSSSTISPRTGASRPSLTPTGRLSSCTTPPAGYVSPPEIAPRSAGAAVDVTPVDQDSHELDLGARVNVSPEKSDGACFTHAPNLGDRTYYHRTLLLNAMEDADFTNHAAEFWHFSAADRPVRRAHAARAACVPVALHLPRQRRHRPTRTALRRRRCPHRRRELRSRHRSGEAAHGLRTLLARGYRRGHQISGGTVAARRDRPGPLPAGRDPHRRRADQRPGRRRRTECPRPDPCPGRDGPDRRPDHPPPALRTARRPDPCPQGRPGRRVAESGTFADLEDPRTGNRTFRAPYPLQSKAYDLPAQRDASSPAETA